jgi:hypothetical protein
MKTRSAVLYAQHEGALFSAYEGEPTRKCCRIYGSNRQACLVGHVAHTLYIYIELHMNIK